MATSVVVPTLSPSMDIQVSSNFERLLFELNHRDGGMTAEQLHRFRATGSLVGRARPARRRHVGVRRRPRGRRRDPRRHRRDLRGAPASSSTPTPRSASGPPPTGATGRCRWSHWPPPTRPSSPTPSRRPPASDPRCQRTWPTCSSGPERTATLPNDLAKVEAFVAGMLAGVARGRLRSVTLPCSARPSALLADGEPGGRGSCRQFTRTAPVPFAVGSARCAHDPRRRGTHESPDPPERRCS